MSVYLQTIFVTGNFICFSSSKKFFMLNCFVVAFTINIYASQLFKRLHLIVLYFNVYLKNNNTEYYSLSRLLFNESTNTSLDYLFTVTLLKAALKRSLQLYL